MEKDAVKIRANAEETDLGREREQRPDEVFSHLDPAVPEAESHTF